MTLLLGEQAVAQRAGVATSALRPLAHSLAAELQPVAERLPRMPLHKAMLSRTGGRCASDGSALIFDPWSPAAHRCGVCGRVHEGERHHRWWIMSQQLWLAERAVIGATLYRLVGSSDGEKVARHVLAQASEHYLQLPNADNVLGPSRPFFSTYLESIWLLQLCVAADLVRTSPDDPLVSRLFERVVEPSAALIASYDEGRSNRQVWNAAALLAAGLLLERDALVDMAVWGRSGMFALLDDALLPDGTWYEGENYHLFAHRGLWYGVALCEAQSITVPAALGARFDEGFATPLLTALPDLTFPSRRDSQYGVSLRQWRTAESFELGVARCASSRLASALHALYAETGERRDTGRWCSTAEAERNAPPGRLSRADLGWKSLLFASAELPAASEWRETSVLLESQGFAVLRPAAGVYAALDYGETGGGHGHPDRLGVILARGNVRWLDDPGTGSYVDPTLFWYRSTLAHNAPLVDGASQRPARGHLLAFDGRKQASWVSAGLPEHATAGVRFRRTLVALPEYVLDLLEWSDGGGHTVDVPFHVPYDASDATGWHACELEPSTGRERGSAFLRDVQCAPVRGDPLNVLLQRGGHAVLQVRLTHPARNQWWRARHPGPPGCPEGAVLALRSSADSGTLASVWSWSGAPRLEIATGGDMTVVIADHGSDHHHRTATGWEVTRTDAEGTRSIALGGVRGAPAPEHLASNPEALSALPTAERELVVLAPGRPFRRKLGERAYRRSEFSWRDAGRPQGEVTITAGSDELQIDVRVQKHPVIFRAAGDDPELDNEHADIHSDGIQLHLLREGAPTPVCWILVPAPGRDTVRMQRSGDPLAHEPHTTWRMEADGYSVQVRLPLRSLLASSNGSFALDVIVNEFGEGRERRRGQLVLSGGNGEYVYLRGDRQPVERYLHFRISGD